MARHCVKFSRGGSRRRRRRGARRGGRVCRFGVVKRGRRKGQCLKSRRARRR